MHLYFGSQPSIVYYIDFGLRIGVALISTPTDTLIVNSRKDGSCRSVAGPSDLGPVEVPKRCRGYAAVGTRDRDMMPSPPSTQVRIESCARAHTHTQQPGWVWSPEMATEEHEGKPLPQSPVLGSCSLLAIQNWGSQSSPTTFTTNSSVTCLANMDSYEAQLDNLCGKAIARCYKQAVHRI